MSKGKIGAIAAAVIVVLILFSGYNSLVTANEDINGKWSQVENQLQRRSDLIPNLVATTKGMAQQEKDVFQAVNDARTKLAGAQTINDKAEASNELSGSLSRLLMIAENYPDIKSDASFRQLADELAGTENRIAVARRDYNNAVQNYNTQIKSLPKSLYAGMLGFNPRDYFKADEKAQETPQVKF